jgi:hypothetical protein
MGGRPIQFQNPTNLPPRNVPNTVSRNTNPVNFFAEKDRDRNDWPPQGLRGMHIYEYVYMYIYIYIYIKTNRDICIYV